MPLRRAAVAEPERVHRSGPGGAVGGPGIRTLSVPCRLYLGLVAFSLAGSLFVRLSHLDPGPIAPVSALLTLGMGAVAAFRPLVREVGTRAWVALALVLALGTAVELTGVITGFPFGRYAYTDRWWPVLSLPNGGWFPLAVPVAWFLMAGACTLAVLSLREGRLGWPSIPLAGLLAAFLDLLMEPVMVRRLAYWHWREPGPLPGGAPVANFLGWFATASLAAIILHRFGASKAWKAPEPKVVLAGHVVLTLGIGLL